jgi:Family of unknown function (DUF6230)
MSAKRQLSGMATVGRVRWRRLAIVIAPAVAIAAILISLTAEGAIAANVSVSGQQFLVTATQLNGTGFEQFGSDVTSSGSGTQPVIVSGIGSATLDHLCQAVKAGPITMRLTAGQGSTPVQATNLIVDASSLAGSSAVFHGITIGQDAGTLTATPGTAGATGGFGEQAETITIRNLVQHTWLTTAGTFTLPGLHLSFGGSCP